ncbi:MAG: PQQ-binding-like beta-propeller repeat protein [Acidobacteriota bacterium]|jgi:outer membrane protein assembly factor BamB
MLKRGEAALIAFLTTLSGVCAFAADWPGYLGPNRDGTSAQKDLLRTWPEDGPKVLWTAPLGVGFGGPAVVGGKVYLLDRDEAIGDTLRVFELSTGTELWSFAYDAPGRFMFPGSRTTPTVDGDTAYTCGPLGDLYAISTTTHEPVWSKNIWTDFGGGGDAPEFRAPPSRAPSAKPGAPGRTPPRPPGGPPGAPGGGGTPGDRPPGRPARQPAAPGPELPRWGITQNPLIYGNLLIVAPQAPEATVVAYDKLTGELKWKSAVLSGGVGYVSPSIVKIGGEDHLVMIMAARGSGRSASGGSVNGLDPLTGKVLWTYENWQCRIPVPHAVDAGQGRVLISGGYLAGTAMIRVDKTADGTYGVTELFKTVDFGAHTQPPILFEEHFYSQYTINERADGLVCMTLDGQIKWKTGEDPPFVRGGSVLADGLLLTTDGDTMLYLVEPDPSGFKPLASAVLLESGTNWAPIALVDGKLLIRDQKHLKCLLVAE